jgi:hypothetical protein
MAADRPPALVKGFGIVGSEMVGFTLLGVAVDYATNGWPWATAVMTLLGLGVALWHLSLMAKAMGRPPT